MRKLVILGLILFATLPLWSQELLANWNLGSVGLGYNYSPNQGNFYLTGDALDLMIQEKSTGLGIVISPVALQSCDDTPRINLSDYDLSLLRIDVFWNIIALNPYSVLGIFAGSNLINIYHQNTPFSTGLLLRWRLPIGAKPSAYFPLVSDVVQVQTGYRYYRNQGNFFAEVRMDLGLLLYFIALTKKPEAEKYYRDTQSPPPQTKTER